MRVVDRVKACASTAVLLSMPILGLAQGGSDHTVADVSRIDAREQVEVEEIVVTGSRIKRRTYTSIPPLQIITGETSREAGLIDAATILQESMPAAGLQANLTLVDRILDNGPGASTIGLRGLDATRTLVLIDGRRVAPAGVEGAPTAADLNLIPGSFVRQYDVLLDGASSVYGSDAIAGVVNVLLRKDFDGLEVNVFASNPDQSSGSENTLSLNWGMSNERGFIGIGIEYENREPVTLGQRSWSADCDRHVEIDEYGNVRHTDLYGQQTYDMVPSDCRNRWLAGWMQLDDMRSYTGGFDQGPGRVYYTTGSTNTGIPNFSDALNSLLAGGLDGDGDGIQDITYADYSLDPMNDSQHIYPDFERISAMAYGEYTLAGAHELTPFFELQYSERDVSGEKGPPQLFPWVAPDNPYNVCNPNGINGIDCAVAWNDHYAQQTVIDRFIAEHGAPPQAFGLGLNAPVGGMWARPVVSIKDDRTLVSTSVAQTRAVAGIRGQLPWPDRGSLEDWFFELAAVYSRSDGESHRPGIRADWLDQSLSTSVVDPVTGDVVCGMDTTGDGIPDGFNADGRSCVPINMWAPSLYEGVVGDFATQGERDYLFDSRDFDTEYEQRLLTGHVSGDLFQMPAGPVAAILGFELREDEIASIPDDVARDGLFFSFFNDGGAVGEKYTRDVFAEVELPLVRDTAIAKELKINVSARHTKDEFFGSDTTYSAKVGWRPVDSMLVRATYGTSFRAPNLRENFLKPSFGELYVSDPCAIPEDALDPISGYDPSRDKREPHILQNCINNGVDPTALDLGGINFYPVFMTQGGTTNLTAETSDSYSYGFVWDQPFFDAFDITIGVTYYEIDVADSIIRPQRQFIVDDCYGSVGLDSVLCSRIERDATGRLDYINGDYINRDEMLRSGYDVNVAYAQGVNWFNRPIDLSIDLALNHPEEVSETFVGVSGVADKDDYTGQWGFADWRGTLTFRADFSDYRLTWSTRFISDVDQDPESVDEFDDVFGNSDTCLGPSLGDVLCRDVGWGDDYYLHSSSLFYYGDRWNIGAGIRNVFNEAPPEVDPTEVISIRNMPYGAGYDLNGRTYFVNIGAKFQ